MRGKNKYILCLIIILSAFTVTEGIAQDRKALEAKRQKLLQQIELTSKRLGEASRDIGNATDDIKAIRAEISTRKKLIANLESEIGLIDRQLDKAGSQLERSRQELSALNKEYAEMLQNAYISRQLENPVLFLLSAQNLNQAFLRWQYLQQLETHRKIQYNKLSAKQDSIQALIRSIDLAKADKEKARSNVLAQQQESSKAEAKQEELVKNLKNNEQSLRAQLTRQEGESKKLAEEIDRIIRAEMAKTNTAESMPDAPAMRRLTNSFTENKGRLPWPVKKGVISGKFGNQPHPVIRTIYINNNGIDFIVEEGAQVHAVFEGVVVGQKFIPGFDEMLIIQHGKYYTVYSRLAQTFVKKGDRVKTQQVIGKAATGTPKPQVHFELWQEKILQDPEKWLID